jgi:hypothetical protein
MPSPGQSKLEDSLTSSPRSGLVQPDGAANGSQPIRSETNRTSAASVEVQLFANVDGVHPHETPAAAVWLPGEEY